MEKIQQRLEKWQYVVSNFCTLLSPGKNVDEVKTPYIDGRMQYATGKELEEVIDVKRLLAIEDPKGEGVFCVRDDCNNCQVLRDYENRLNKPNSSPTFEKSPISC